MKEEKRKREADAVIQLRIDRRYLATILQYCIKEGIVPRNRNHLLKIVVENFTDIIIRSGGTFVETTHEANRLLEKYGMGDLNPRRELGANLLKNLNIDLIEAEPEIEEGDTAEISADDIAAVLASLPTSKRRL